MLHRIHAQLEDRLIAQGFERGVLASLGSKLNTRVKTRPDSDWDYPPVFQENLNDLTHWAVGQLKRLKITQRTAQVPQTPIAYGHTTAALAYRIATDPEIQAEVSAIRMAFWNTELPPFPAKTLGIRTSLQQAGLWLDQEVDKDKKAGISKHFLGFDLVLQNQESAKDLWDSLKYVMTKHLSTAQPDGTYMGSPVTLAQVCAAIQEELETESVQVVHKSIRGCAEDGSNDRFLELRGVDGWTRNWPLRYAGQTYELDRRCRALAKKTTKWSEAETLEYILIGNVPSLGPRLAWQDAGWLAPTLTLTFRAPVTRDEALKAYDGAMKQQMLTTVKARRLSRRQQAVLQLVHDMPDATWGERLRRYEEWRQRHPELPEYRGVAAQQAIRKDYVRATERADWQPVEARFDELAD